MRVYIYAYAYRAYLCMHTFTCTNLLAIMCEQPRWHMWNPLVIQPCKLVPRFGRPSTEPDAKSSPKPQGHMSTDVGAAREPLISGMMSGKVKFPGTPRNSLSSCGSKDCIDAERQNGHPGMSQLLLQSVCESIVKAQVWNQTNGWTLSFLSVKLPPKPFFFRLSCCCSSHFVTIFLIQESS